MALWNRTRAGNDLDGLVHHSDRGVQGGFNWSSQHLDDGRCLVGVWERQRQVRESRGLMPSPGRPGVAWRDGKVNFWTGIARGVKTEEAGLGAGVSMPVVFRWFHHAGGVRPCLPR